MDDMDSKPAFVTLRDVGLQFENSYDPILQDVDLSVQKKEFVSIVGKSGTGKTSLLKMIAGLLLPTTGTVKIDNQVISEPRSEVNYVFQRPVLLEWRNLLENILLPIELHRKVGAEDVGRARDLLKLVGLSGDEEKFPHECSGGMLSRVSLARALLTNPEILLMDEPFSALDAITKEQLQLELAEISSRYQPTTVFITHDINEAVFLSDRVIVLGDQPARVIAEVQIPFDRPRRKELKFQPEFIQVMQRIHEYIEKERYEE
jgi:NitT/TauT family transport system ATP-binding protein